MSKNTMQNAAIINGNSLKSLQIIGKRFGNLLVKNYLGRRVKCKTKDGKISWVSVVEAVCDCGVYKKYDTWVLTSGQVKSCGCVSNKVGASKRTKHGHAARGNTTTEYSIWLSMKNRCRLKNNIRYSNYGGRGIKVCDRWLNSFENFLQDMGHRPSCSHSIDRINNDGDYEPNNCRWATSVQQGRNKSTNRILVYNGNEICLSELSILTGICDSTLSYRIKKWGIEKAISCPLGESHKFKK